MIIFFGYLFCRFSFLCFYLYLVFWYVYLCNISKDVWCDGLRENGLILIWMMYDLYIVLFIVFVIFLFVFGFGVVVVFVVLVYFVD